MKIQIFQKCAPWLILFWDFSRMQNFHKHRTLERVHSAISHEMPGAKYDVSYSFSQDGDDPYLCQTIVCKEFAVVGAIRQVQYFECIGLWRLVNDFPRPKRVDALLAEYKVKP